MEDCLDERGGELRVKIRPSLDDRFESDAAFDDDNRAEPGFGEEHARWRELGRDGGGALLGGPEESRFTQTDQRSAEFRLEDNDEGERETCENAVVEVGEPCEGVFAEHTDDHGSNNEDEDESFDGASGAGALEEAEDEVHDDPDDGQLNKHLPRVVRAETAE